MDLEEIKNIAETDYLKLLSQYLKTGKIKLPEAKEVTKEFLALLPFADIEDLQTKLKSFTEKHPEFNQVYLTFLRKEDLEKTADLVEKMKCNGLNLTIPRPTKFTLQLNFSRFQ